MFRIGDFARMTGVSVKTLRYYDQIGLFTPQQVDPFTGYRYYSFTQLPRLNRLVALKDLGFPLEQVARLLDNDLPPEQIAGMLVLRRSQLQQQVEEAQARLAQVEARLQQIRNEGRMPTNDILLKVVDPVWVASAREVVPTPEQMRERCIALMNEVEALVSEANLTSTGVSLALYHDHSEAGIDVEMALFLADTPAAGAKHGRAVVRQLPAVATMAYAVYRGSYDDFAAVGQLHADMGHWIEANGYHVSGPSREIYLQVPQPFNNEGVMEIQFPVEKR